MNETMISFIPKSALRVWRTGLGGYIKDNYQNDLHGRRACTGTHDLLLAALGRRKDDDSLVRMALNEKGLISGLLFSDPFDTAAHAKK